MKLRTTILLFSMLCGPALAGSSKDQMPKAIAESDIVIPAEEMRYLGPVKVKTIEPADLEPTSISYVSLREDSLTGARTFLTKLTRGSDGNHTHPDAYEAIVLKGILSHWISGVPGSEKRQLGPGSYWYQAPKELHREDCLSDECILFVVHKGLPAGK